MTIYILINNKLSNWNLKMEKEEFNNLMKEANLTKKEFADIIGITPGSLNNWGSTQNIPYWVKTWLENYIKAQDLKKISDIIKPLLK